MAADPEDPIPPPGVPSDWADQERILAEEMAAFPAQDEPDCEALEYLDDGDAGGEGPWLADLPGAAPGDHPGSAPAEHSAAAPDAGAGAGAGGAGVPVPGTMPPAEAASSGGSRSPFTQGGMADVMAPGPLLAVLADQVWRDGLDSLNADELTGVLAAAHRLGGWVAALEFSAAGKLVALREAEARASGDWRGVEHAGDEIALALTLTRPGAARVLDLAVALGRLPLTSAALAAGRIDERRAAVIADELSGLDDEDAAAVEALIIEKAAGQTTGQLRPAVHRAVIAADPAAAKRRKEEALKGARVETRTAPSGTAALAGRDLPPAEVLAADKYLTALARSLKKAGAPGTMDQLRARAYLHLLGGGTLATLLTPPDADTGTTGDGIADGGAPGRGTPGTGAPDTGGDGTPSGRPPGDGRATGPGSTADSGTDDGGTPGDGEAADPSSTADGSTADGDSTDGGDSTANGDSTADGGGPGAPGPRLPALRGTVNLTMPLAAWLGWSQSPGQVPGFGTLDADDSRALAGMLARDPASKWCITLTDPAGHAIAHGCAKHGPGPAGPVVTNPGSDPRAGPGPPPWISAITITPIQTGTCDHPRETRSYQPTQALRHIIEIRQATCSSPTCRRAATACDLDHTIPWHLGGRTCECDLGPVCRHDHHLKQAPGWTLTQTQPGHMAWTTPSGRTYTTGPTSYPD